MENENKIGIKKLLKPPEHETRADQYVGVVRGVSKGLRNKGIIVTAVNKTRYIINRSPEVAAELRSFGKIEKACRVEEIAHKQDCLSPERNWVEIVFTTRSRDGDDNLDNAMDYFRDKANNEGVSFLTENWDFDKNGLPIIKQKLRFDRED
jgi:hypothetical protein